MQKSLSYKPYTLFQPARDRNNQPQEPQQPTRQPTEARQRKRAARALRVSAGDHSTRPGRQCRQAMATGPTTKDPAREKGLQTTTRVPRGDHGSGRPGRAAAAVGRRRSTARAISRWRETLRLSAPPRPWIHGQMRAGRGGSD